MLSTRSVSPWDVNVYDAQVVVLGISGAAHTNLRFRGAELERLDSGAFAAVLRELGTYVGLGGLTLGASRSPWAGAAVTSGTEERAPLELVTRLHPHGARASALLHAAADETGARTTAASAGRSPAPRNWR